MISLDTETTGTDLRHGAKPFLVTSCDEEGVVRYWRWQASPEARDVFAPISEIQEVQKLLDEADRIVLQNAKFDAKALDVMGISLPWDKVEDTLIAGHLLNSAQPHDLTSMVMEYLGEDIEPYEKALKEEVEKARRFCRSKLPSWRIAKSGLPDMPSAKDSTWKYDTWLPLALAEHLDKSSVPRPKSWSTVLERYANVDSVSTLQLWKVLEVEINQRKLWTIYREQMRLPSIAFEIEELGITQ